MTKLPYTKRVWIATQMVMRARLYYDIWWYYQGVDTRTELIGTMRRYNEFFRFDSNAHFLSMVIHIGAVFEPNKRRNINIEALINEGKHHGVPESEVIAAKRNLKEVNDVREGIKKLRDKLFAHRDASLAHDSVFAEANIIPDDIPRLTDVGLEIGNMLLRHIGADQETFFNPALEDIRRLFGDLKPVDKERVAP